MDQPRSGQRRQAANDSAPAMQPARILGRKRAGGEGRGTTAIAPTNLPRRERLHGRCSLVWRDKDIRALAAPRADSSPPPDQKRLPEQGDVQRQSVEAGHVAHGIVAFKMKRRRVLLHVRSLSRQTAGVQRMIGIDPVGSIHGVDDLTRLFRIASTGAEEGNAHCGKKRGPTMRTGRVADESVAIVRFGSRRTHLED